MALTHLKEGPHTPSRNPVPRCCHKQAAQREDKAPGRYSREVKPERQPLLPRNTMVGLRSAVIFSHIFTLSTARQIVSRENILHSLCKQINKNALKFLRLIAISSLKPIQYLTSQRLHTLFIASQITLGEGGQSKSFCIKNDQVLFFSFNFN